MQAEITALSNTEQEIHTIVKYTFSNSSWMMSAIYASPRYAEQRLFWENLFMVVGMHSLPWMIVGDFNKILLGENKYGVKL